MRLNVVFQKTLAGLERGRSEFYFRVVFHPHFQPTPHGVLLGPPIVDAHIFFDGLFQLFLDLGLRLAENILDDGFAGFRIVTDCVAALPSSILALSDIAFSVCSSFWHKIDLLCNGTQYRKRQRKAMGKPHYYQKVINSQPPLATVYKGNIIKNLIMDCQSYTKYRPNETTGGIFVSWRRKEELPTGA